MFLHCVQVFKNLRDDGQYDESASELDAALVQLASSPNFPKVLLKRCFLAASILILHVVMFYPVSCRVLRISDQKHLRWQENWL